MKKKIPFIKYKVVEETPKEAEVADAPNNTIESQ